MAGLKVAAFLVICVSFAVSVHGYCSDYALSSCMDNTVFEKYKNKKSQELFVYHSEQEMAQVCSDIQTVERCWKPIIDDCQLAVRALFQGIRDGFKYMCGDGYNKYMNNRECLSKPILADKGKQCSTTLNQKVANFQREAASGLSTKSELKDEACKYIDDAKKCVYDAVRSECTEEAAKFEKNFVDKMLRPLEQIVGCGALTTIQIFLIIGGACLGILILASLAVLVYRHMRGSAVRRGVVLMPPESGESGFQALPHTDSQKPNLEFENPLSQQYESPPPYRT